MTMWKTKDGREIAIRDMEDGHLLNAMRMLERSAPVKARALAWQADTYTMTAPEHAGDAALQEAMDLYDLAEGERVRCAEYVWPSYGHLWMEAKKRGLDV